mgnify:CR=1 FL=1
MDWEDPEAARTAFGAVVSRLNEVESRLQNETTTIRGEFAQGRDNVMQLINLLQQAERIEKEDLYGHMGYKPQRDVTEIVRYASQNGMTDLHQAAQARYGEQQTEQRIKAAVEQERHRLQQETQNKQLATERGSRGTPRGMIFRGERRDSKQQRTGRAGLRSGHRDYDGLYEEINKRSPDIEWVS